MTASIAVGTLVLIVRTGTGLDGATGAVIGPLTTRRSVDVFNHAVGVTTGYKVRLARCTPWGEELLIVPQCLVPLLPPGFDRIAERDAPVHLAGVV